VREDDVVDLGIAVDDPVRRRRQRRQRVRPGQDGLADRRDQAVIRVVTMGLERGRERGQVTRCVVDAEPRVGEAVIEILQRPMETAEQGARRLCLSRRLEGVATDA
jgi:hypothetical protein